MAFIDLFAIAILIVAGVLVFQNRRATGAATPSPPTDHEARHLAEEVRELRARIQVLERVITDNHGSSDLADEIDRLRDR
jgi:hypothetical protein